MDLEQTSQDQDEEEVENVILKYNFCSKHNTKRNTFQLMDCEDMVKKGIKKRQNQ